jgi:hypothetical protein
MTADREIRAFRLWPLVASYFLASLLHFSHNAEYIALYPNLPASFTRESVYLAWLAVTAVGLAGGALRLLGWPIAAALVLGAYGALGLAGLAHYTLALCSEHTLTTNLTIWFEALTGLSVAGAALWQAGKLARMPRGRFT